MADLKPEESFKSLVPEALKKAETDLKKKLRSLVKSESSRIISTIDESSDEFEDSSETRNSRLKRKHLAVIVSVLFVFAAWFASFITISKCGFWATYENNFNKIVYNDERWCYRKLEASPSVKNLKEEVIGQDDAIKLISASLDLANREWIIQMAFVGPIGTGKTLSANILARNFKWQQNVQRLVFDINFGSRIDAKEVNESDYNLVASKLSDCGFNLVVVDDVRLEDSAVQRIAALERRLHRLAKQKLFKIVLVVIFSDSADSSDLVSELKNFVLVEFNAFTEETFHECIRVHEKIHNVKLKQKDIEELRHINFTNTGCKTLAKKLNLIADA